MNHLHAATEIDVRNAMLGGLLELRRMHPTRFVFEYKEIVGQVARTLTPLAAANTTNEWDLNRNIPLQAPNSVGEQPDNRKLMSAMWSLIGEGYLFPRLTDQPRAGALSVHIIRLVLTDKLERLALNADAHPRHPGFIRRFQRTTPTVTDEVVAYLEDAVSCAEMRLCRPALTMVGVANEQTIRTTHDALIHLALVVAPGQNPGARTLLGDIHAVVATWQVAGVSRQKTNEDRHRLAFATTFSEALRVERNKVAHPGASLGDEVMVEQMLMGFAHHAAAYWEIIVQHAKTQGFQP